MKLDGLGVAALGLTVLLLTSAAIALGANVPPDVNTLSDPICDPSCREWLDIAAQQAMADAAWWMTGATIVSVLV